MAIPKVPTLQKGPKVRTTSTPTTTATPATTATTATTATAAPPGTGNLKLNLLTDGAQVAGLFISILAGKLSGDAENFTRVLAKNGRLELLPQIREQFEALKNEREGVVEADVQSAFELSEAQLGDLVQRLERKTGRKVRAHVTVDRELIGGIKVVLGDKVIDGSARAQLGALETALKA